MRGLAVPQDQDPEPTGLDLVRAVEDVTATGPENSDQSTTLVSQVVKHLAAQQHLNETLLRLLGERGALVLLEALVDIHRDPLDDEPATRFLEQVQGG